MVPLSTVLLTPPSLRSSTQSRTHHCVYSQARSIHTRPLAYAQKRAFPLSTIAGYHFQRNSFRPPLYTQRFPITIGFFTPFSNRQASNSEANPDSTSSAHLRTRLNFKPSPSHWLLTLPQVILDLTQYPKCPTNPTAYCAHFLEIASRFPKAILCYTEGPNPTILRVLRARSTKWFMHIGTAI